MYPEESQEIFCVYPCSGGECFLEASSDNVAKFLSSSSILIGDIDIYTPKGSKEPQDCVPSYEYALSILRVAISYWGHLSWNVWRTPGGIRFSVDTIRESQETRELILQSTCCDPLYRLISKRRGYYSARLLPKEGRDKAVLSQIIAINASSASEEYNVFIGEHNGRTLETNTYPL